MAEDRRAVLAAEVEALAVAGGRIVDPPERLEQLGVADLGRVEPHLDRLGVAGATPADPFVAGVGDVAAGVARSGLQHPWIWRKAASVPQKHPAANVARSAPSGPCP